MPKKIRERKNVHEADFEARAKSKGFFVTKQGWPDFLCFKNGRIYAVEVKPPTNRGEMRLKPSQHLVMVFLTKHGIPCFVSDGTVTEKFDPVLHAPRNRKFLGNLRRGHQDDPLP